MKSTIDEVDWVDYWVLYLIASMYLCCYVTAVMRLG